MTEEQSKSLKENVEECVKMLRQALDMDDGDEWQEEPTCPHCGGAVEVGSFGQRLFGTCLGECKRTLKITAKYQVRVS